MLEQIVKILFGTKTKSTPLREVAAPIAEAPPTPQMSARERFEASYEQYKTTAKGLGTSGCGCSRYPARDFISARDGYASTTIAAYLAADEAGKLHSSCCRDSGFTSSNISVGKQAVESALDLIGKNRGQDKEFFIAQLERVLYAAKGDFSKGQSSIIRELTERVVKYAEHAAAQGEYYSAMRLADAALHFAGYEKNGTDLEKRNILEMFIDASARKAITETCTSTMPYDKKLERLRGSIRYEIKDSSFREKLDKRLDSMKPKPTAEKELIGVIVDKYESVREKPDSLKYELESELKKKLGVVEQEEKRAYEKLDSKISVYDQQIAASGASLMGDVARKARAGLLEEKSKVKTVFDEKRTVLDKQIGVQIRDISAYLGTLSKLEESYLEKIKSRKLTEKEYTALTGFLQE